MRIIWTGVETGLMAGMPWNAWEKGGMHGDAAIGFEQAEPPPLVPAERIDVATSRSVTR